MWPVRPVAALLASVLVPAFAGDFQLEGNQLVVPGPMVFETGRAILKAESGPVLDHVKAYLDAKTYLSLMRVEVHVDPSGNPAADQLLTEQRALAVVRALVARGVDCQRLLPVGFGATKPAAANDTPAHRAENRRTVFVNAALRGRAIGGLPVDGGGRVAGKACE